MTTSLLLQDWIHLESPVSSSIVQCEADWLDMSAFVDVDLHLTVKHTDATGAITLEYQTSPSKDEDLFQAMTGASLAISTATTHTVTRVRFDDTTVDIPLARWLRWKLTTGEGAIDITFRIWVSAVSRGRAIDVPPPLGAGLGQHFRGQRGEPGLEARALRPAAHVDPGLTAPRGLPERMHLLRRMD